MEPRPVRPVTLSRPDRRVSRAPADPAAQTGGAEASVPIRETPSVPPKPAEAPADAAAVARERNRAALADILLKRALFLYACANCGGNNPEIYKTDGETRYCKCRQCGQNVPGKIVVTAPTDAEVAEFNEARRKGGPAFARYHTPSPWGAYNG